MSNTKFMFLHDHCSRNGDGSWQLPPLVGYYDVLEMRDLVRQLMDNTSTKLARLTSITMERGNHNVPLRLEFVGSTDDITSIDVTADLMLDARFDTPRYMADDEPVHYSAPVTYLADRHVFATGQAVTDVNALMITRVIQLAEFNPATPAVIGNKVVSRANRDMLNTPWFVNRAKGDPARTAEYVVEDNHTSSTAISKLTVIRDVLGGFSITGYMNASDCKLPEDPYLKASRKVVSIPHGSSYAVPLSQAFQWGDVTVDTAEVMADITRFSLLGYIA